MKTKKILVWIVTAALLLASFAVLAPQSVVRETEALTLEDAQPAEGVAPKATVTSGKCGSSLKWSYDPSTKALTITGSGRMFDYGPDYENPWVVNGFASQVKTVTLPKGMTYIGAYAFYSLRAVTFFSIPANVTTIGEGAFEQCTALKSVAISKKVTKVDAYAFSACSALTKVFYEGTAAQRSLINIGYDNTYFTNATWTYETSDNLAFKSQPKDVKATEGKTVSFKVKTVGARTIQWQFQRPGNSTWYNISGANSEVYSFTAAASNNDYLYRCRITNPVKTLFSNTVKLTVKLAIKTQPKAAKVEAGLTATFTVKATGATKLQWQCQGPGEVSWTNLAGATTDTYSLVPSMSQNGYSYRCAASNNSATVYSKAAKLTVKYVPLAIKTQPKSVTTDRGKTVTFKVKAAGASSIQWQYQKPGTTAWYNVSGATSETYSFTADVGHTGYSYRCKIANPVTTSAPVYSNVVTLNVNLLYKALLIGNGAGYVYQNKLQGPSKDVAAMKKALEKMSPKYSVTVKQDLTASQMTAAIKEAFQGMTSYDVCLFYYSGHGDNRTGTTAGSLVGVNCSGNNDLLSPATLASTLNSACPGKVIVLLDSCGSGSTIYDSSNGLSAGSNPFGTAVLPNSNTSNDAFTDAVVNAFSTLENNTAAPNSFSPKTGELMTSKFSVLAACAHGTTSEDIYYTGHQSGILDFPRGGLFTVCLLKAAGFNEKGSSAGKMKGDVNGDKVLSLQEAYDFINDEIQRMKDAYIADYGYNGAYVVYNYDLFSQQTKMYGSSTFALFRRK